MQISNDIIALSSILSGIVCFFLLERKPPPVQQHHHYHPPPPQPQPTNKAPRFNAFNCKVLWHEVSDGDTIKVKVDNPQIMWLYPQGFAVRVLGINTAEIHAKKGLGFIAARRQTRELKKGFKQKEQAEELLKGCSLIELRVVDNDKYGGRFLGDFTLTKAGKRINFSEWMIKYAGAKRYAGHGVKDW